jgi:hypothetical protein
MRSVPALALALAALFAAGPRAAAPALDWNALARRIVRALALRPGETVVLIPRAGEMPELVVALHYAVAEAGAVDLGAWETAPLPAPAPWSGETMAKGRAASLAAMTGKLAGVDAFVMLPGAVPDDPAYGAAQEVLRSGRGRAVHFHWRSGGIASASAVPGHPLPPDAAVDAVYQRAVLSSDCRAIGAVERRFAAALRRGEVRVTTPAGTDLRFRVGDRPIDLQDGDASAARMAEARVLIDREIEIPCGAVRVAPLEETVDGTIAFPPARWGGEPVEGLTMRFARGRVVDLAARQGRASVERELAGGGAAARAFRELAVGFNPELAVPAGEPWIPYFGYGAGVVRLSLGDNAELGGAVRGDYVRWNLFTDATVEAGGEVWVRDGKLQGR